MTIPKSEGRVVDFSLALDVENHASCAFDHVIIEDATGWRSSKFCGRTSWKLTNLATPVKVIFKSDRTITSTSVKVSKIVASGNGSASDEPREAESPGDTAEEEVSENEGTW